MKLILKRILFYILSFTWGLPQTLIGLICIITLAPFGKIHVYHGRLYAAIGKNWGGLELGCFFLRDTTSTEQITYHECGHGLQNIIWGPLMIPVISLPSIIRYWYRELKYERKGIKPPTEYDAIWFEHQATTWGDKYIRTDLW